MLYVYQFSAARSSTLLNTAFIEAKIVILAPFVYHISIFSLIRVVKKFGPIHSYSYMRPWVAAIFSIFLVRVIFPKTGSIVKRQRVLFFSGFTFAPYGLTLALWFNARFSVSPAHSFWARVMRFWHQVGQLDRPNFGFVNFWLGCVNFNKMAKNLNAKIANLQATILVPLTQNFVWSL